MLKMSFEESVEILQLTQNLLKIGFNLTDDDVQRIAKGDPWIFVSIYHFLFFEYEKLIKCNISHGISAEAFNKTGDSKVSICGIYKILKNIFSYEPPLTLEEFTTESRSKEKVLMCQEVLKLIQSRIFYLKATSSIHQQGDGCNPYLQTKS